MRIHGDLSRGLRNGMGAGRRVFVGVLIAASLGAAALAQVSGITPEQIQQQLQQQQQRGGNTTVQTGVMPRDTILEPTAPSASLPQSELERVLSARAGVKLQQFGYDQLGIGRAVSLPQVGAVQDSYVLGVGDEIVLTLRGQENNEYHAQVDRDGNVTFPRLNPVSATGRTFGQFRQDISSAIHRAYTSTDGFVTVGRLRQISVLVSGEVGSPGVRTLTGLSTAVDAIFVSGGIKKSGSLRSVHILRGGQVRTVDLYSMLVGKVRSSNFALADGDKVIVPPVGATIAVAGEVRQPGIYELAPGQSAIRVRDAVALASGMTVPGTYSVSQLRTMADGKRQLVDVTGGTDAVLRDGEIVFVRTSVNMSINQVTLVGAVRTPGAVALGKFKTIHDLLPSSDALLPGAYLLFGIVERTDPVTLQRTAVPFSPLLAIQGKSNFALMSDDTVHIFTKKGMRVLIGFIETARPNDVVARMRLAAPTAEAGRTSPLTNVPNRDALAAQGSERGVGAAGIGASQTDALAAQGSGRGVGVAGVGASQTDALAAQGSGRGVGVAGIGAPQAAVAAEAGANASGTPAPPVAAEITADTDVDGFTASQASLKTLANYRVILSGAVYDPGTYLVFPGTPTSNLLAAAGGLTEDVDLSSFELTSTVINNSTGESTTERKLYPATKEVFASLELKPYDRLVFHNVYSDRNIGLVSVTGEVRYPGSFDILRGEKLSSVLRRAGGFTEIAYPEGAVFRRTSVARAEQEESGRIAADMRSQLLVYLLKPPAANGSSQGVTAETIGAIQALLTQVSSSPALGRVPIVADLPTLDKHPELDIMLEPGDNIVVPRHPATVLVVGEVLRAGAQRFNPSSNADDYVERAGGTTEVADTSRIIVVLPDGSVRSNGNSWLNFGSDSEIPVGSTIYVPRQLEVYEFRQLVTDSIQIFSQLATTAAALSVLSKQ